MTYRLIYCIFILYWLLPIEGLTQEWPISGSHNVAFTFNSGNLSPSIVTYPDGQHNAVDIVGAASSEVMIPGIDLWEINNVIVPNVNDQLSGVKNVAVLLKNQFTNDLLYVNHVVKAPESINLYNVLDDGIWEADLSLIPMTVTNGEVYALLAPLGNLDPNSP